MRVFVIISRHFPVSHTKISKVVSKWKSVEFWHRSRDRWFIAHVFGRWKEISRDSHWWFWVISCLFCLSNEIVFPSKQEVQCHTKKKVEVSSDVWRRTHNYECLRKGDLRRWDELKNCFFFFFCSYENKSRLTWMKTDRCAYEINSLPAGINRNIAAHYSLFLFEFLIWNVIIKFYERLFILSLLSSFFFQAPFIIVTNEISFWRMCLVGWKIWVPTAFRVQQANTAACKN